MKTVGTQEKPKFMVDHMLIKVGKYLRILGFDAAWRPDARTHELITRANAEMRVFLTCNTHVPHQYPQPSRMITLKPEDPVAQVASVVKTLNLDTSRWLFSRCVRCNVELEAVPEKMTVKSRVHPNVYRRNDRFFSCPSCGTVFWHGSHVQNTIRKLGL